MADPRENVKISVTGHVLTLVVDLTKDNALIAIRDSLLAVLIGLVLTLGIFGLRIWLIGGF